MVMGSGVSPVSVCVMVEGVGGGGVSGKRCTSNLFSFVTIMKNYDDDLDSVDDDYHSTSTTCV